MINRFRFRQIVAAGTKLLLLSAVAVTAWGGFVYADEDAVVDNSKSTQKLRNLERSVGQRKVVAIYEFRSSVAEVSARGATDMFTTALLKSGAFSIVERARVQDGVMREKHFNAVGQTSGNAGRKRLAAAQYIFEGTVSEANQGQGQTEGGISFGGMQIGGGGSEDSIGIDVRIVDVGTGAVVDAVNVTKAIGSSGVNVSGIGNLLTTIRNHKGRQQSTYTPDANLKTSRKEGVDRALRACIEVAVAELVERYGKD